MLVRRLATGLSGLAVVCDWLVAMSDSPLTTNSPKPNVVIGLPSSIMESDAFRESSSPGRLFLTTGGQ